MPRNEKRSKGFTLIELLVVIAIIAMLVALLMPALAAARRNAKNAGTKAIMHNLQLALEDYRLDAGMYPIAPGGTGMIYDNGVSAYNPGFYGTTAGYDHPCAGLNAVATGAETNKLLCDVLIKTRFLDVQKAKLVNGELQDYFGHPLIARMLVLPPGVADAEKLTEKIYIWSYGSDGKNGVNATGSYTNQGLPNYDQAEAANIEASPDSNQDDLTTWR